MGRKPDTQEDKERKLALSFQQEIRWLREAHSSPTGIFLDFPSEGNALNRAQRLNRCRALLRKIALGERKVETFENIFVRRQGTRLLLEKIEPTTIGQIQTTKVEFTPQGVKELTDEVLLKMLQGLEEHRRQPLNYNAVAGLLLESEFNGDPVEMLARLEELPGLKKTDKGDYTTRAEG